MSNPENTRPAGALGRLRRRWLAPSRPLAVDDVPHWQPADDPEGEAVRSEDEQDASPAGPSAG